MAIAPEVPGQPVGARATAGQWRHLRPVPTNAVVSRDELVEVLLPRAGVAVVVLRGEHGLTTNELLSGVLSLVVEGNDLVVVDVSEATFIDSSTLGTIVHADRAARVAGSHLRLQVGTSPIVRRLIEITGLLRVLDWAPTRETALSAPFPPKSHVAPDRSPTPDPEPPKPHAYVSDDAATTASATLRLIDTRQPERNGTWVLPPL
jgi:anti-sigma B factor antagonist